MLAGLRGVARGALLEELRTSLRISFGEGGAAEAGERYRRAKLHLMSVTT
jgi:hypothetical protein